MRVFFLQKFSWDANEEERVVDFIGNTSRSFLFFHFRLWQS